MPSDKHSLRSSTREEYVEYMLLGELCSIGWAQDRFVEVARAHTDAQGYDFVLACGNIMRHVQLKASKAGGRARGQNVNLALATKPGGCVVWSIEHPDTLRPVEFRWFGGSPGQDLPDLGTRVARHTKGNASGQKSYRDAIRVLPKSRFVTLTTPQELFTHLFGDARDLETC